MSICVTRLRFSMIKTIRSSLWQWDETWDIMFIDLNKRRDLGPQKAERMPILEHWIKPCSKTKSYALNDDFHFFNVRAYFRTFACKSTRFFSNLSLIFCSNITLQTQKTGKLINWTIISLYEPACVEMRNEVSVQRFLCLSIVSTSISRLSHNSVGIAQKYIYSAMLVDIAIG